MVSIVAHLAVVRVHTIPQRVCTLYRKGCCHYTAKVAVTIPQFWSILYRSLSCWAILRLGGVLCLLRRNFEVGRCHMALVTIAACGGWLCVYYAAIFSLGGGLLAWSIFQPIQRLWRFERNIWLLGGGANISGWGWHIDVVTIPAYS